MPDYVVGITLKSDGSGAVVSDFKEVGDAGKKAGGGLDAAGKSATKTKSSFKKLVPSVATVAKGMLAIGAATIGAVAHYAKFGTAIAEVNTLLDDSFDSGTIEKLSDGARELAKTYGGSATEQAKALYQTISAGAGSAAEAMTILDRANKLAIGGNTDVTTAVDGLSAALNTYGDQGLTAEQASDSMFVAMKSGITTIGELSSSLSKVTPLSSQLGISFDEVNAAAAAMTTTKMSTAEAMTGLTGVMKAVIKPTKEAADMAKELGLDFSSAALKSQGLAGFLESVAQKTGGSSDAMSVLFGDIEGLKAVMSLTGGQAGKFADILDEMANKSGATAESFGKMTTGTAKVGFEWERTKAKISDAFLALGEKAAPAIGELLEMINKIDFTAIGEKIGTAVSAVIQGAKAIYNGAMVWFDKLRTDPAAAAEEASISMAAKLGSAVGGIANAMGSAFGAVSEWLEKIKNAPEGSLNAMVDSIKTWMGNMLSAFADGFSEVAPEAVKAFKALPETMKQLGIDAIAGLIAGLKAAPGKLVEAAKDVADSVYKTVKGFFISNSPSKLFMDVGKDVVLGLSLGITENGYIAVKASESLATEVSASFGVLQSDMNGYQQEAVKSMGVISESMDEAGEAATQYADNLREDIGGALTDVVLNSGSFADQMGSLWKRLIADFLNSGVSKVFSSLLSGKGLDLSGFSMGGLNFKSIAAGAKTAAGAISGLTSTIGGYFVATEGAAAATTELGASSIAAQGELAALSESTAGATAATEGMSAGMGALIGVSAFAVGAMILHGRHNKKLAETADEVREKFQTASNVIQTSALTWGEWGNEGLIALNNVKDGTQTFADIMRAAGESVRIGADGMLIMGSNTESARQLALAYSDTVSGGLSYQMDLMKKKAGLLETEGEDRSAILQIEKDITAEWKASVDLINSTEFSSVVAEFEDLGITTGQIFRDIAADGMVTRDELKMYFGDAAGSIIEDMGDASSITITELNAILGIGKSSASGIGSGFKSAASEMSGAMVSGVGEIQTAINGLQGAEVYSKNVITNEYRSSEGGGDGYATGGIASGPLSGYTETLHGVEAIVPLDGGRSIPVEIKGESGVGSTKNVEKLLQLMMKEMERIGSKQTKAIEINTANRAKLSRDQIIQNAMEVLSINA